MKTFLDHISYMVGSALLVFALLSSIGEIIKLSALANHVIGLFETYNLAFWRAVLVYLPFRIDISWSSTLTAVCSILMLSISVFAEYTVRVGYWQIRREQIQGAERKEFRKSRKPPPTEEEVDVWNRHWEERNAELVAKSEIARASDSVGSSGWLLYPMTYLILVVFHAGELRDAVQAAWGYSGGTLVMQIEAAVIVIGLVAAPIFVYCVGRRPDLYMRIPLPVDVAGIVTLMLGALKYHAFAGLALLVQAAAEDAPVQYLMVRRYLAVISMVAVLIGLDLIYRLFVEPGLPQIIEELR